MRKFLDDMGESSDEDERQGQEKGGGFDEEKEEDQSMASIDAYIEKLRDQEAAEEKRYVREGGRGGCVEGESGENGCVECFQ